MKKPITMLCNKEQFEAIKPKLEKIGRICELIGSFQKYKYLTNNFNQNIHKNLEFDFIESDICWREEHQNNIRETWNERIFLEACGIEAEETFEITKETIIKYKMKDEFPEVFKKEEQNGWYKDKEYPLWLCFFENDCLIYGFYIDGDYFINKKPVLDTDKTNDIPATEQEVFEALKNEAVKRGFVKGVYLEKSGINKDFNHKLYSCGDFSYYPKTNILDDLNGNGHIFHNGTWATIIPTKTKEEAEKLLNCKIV